MARYKIVLPLLFSFFGCNSATETSQATSVNATTKTDSTVQAPVATTDTVKALAGEVPFAGKQVPILCYHQIRDWRATDSKSAQVYIVPVAAFKDQIKTLHDSGYHTILPDQLVEYLQHGKPLPSKPIMLTFDDATESQITAALPELDKAGYKAVFFIMTVVLGRPTYMTKDQVKQLAAKGHVVGCHTWDHHMTTKYKEEDWKIQVEKPKALLETITGMPVKYFAYPFGLWNKNAVAHIKQHNFTASFQLAAKLDADDPLQTIRRIIPAGQWSTARLMTAINRDF
ncbi:MAG: polysaccharide deacetylase family protein [Bacteroidota bacterium]